ncbi:MAG: DUF1501 domain-containing protein [Gammaproteobacteria bacterium]|nr:DUF1501 domain-containing protein [Gammaproteobacteria bacterium]MBM4233025.1 DUF1501 domain-containing protein [Gammaproteobacteria bacterium]
MNSPRRRFLKYASAGGLAYALGKTSGSGFAQMTGVGGFSDYRALVCIFLFGGNDSWNMIVPTSAAEYNVYAKSRGAGTSSSLALDRSSLLPISLIGASASDPTFGFNPNMPEMRDLFSAGRLAVIPNVGPLIRPTSKTQYQSASTTGHELPPQLFSHNDQQDQWQSLSGRALLNTGWAGRAADALMAQTGSQQIPLNISLSGQTLFQASQITNPYVMGGGGVNVFNFLNCCGPNISNRRVAVESSLAAASASNRNSIYHRGYARVQQRAIRYADLLKRTLDSSRDFKALPAAAGREASWLTAQLRTVAKMISQRLVLSMSRQIFFVSIGGFDTHDTQLVDHPKLLADVSKSIKAFYDSMIEIGLERQVTVFTQSDFGRTLTSNGDGSDHGWGGTQMVIGGAVLGGRFFGKYPTLEMGGELEIGNGNIIPTLSCDQYAATLARWFGVSDSAISTVAPNIVNFSQRDLGFMVG